MSMDSDVVRRFELLTQRIRVIEANIAVLAEQAGMTIQQPADETPSEAEALVLAGNKIEAIKRYRELTGVSLAEAKGVIDQI